MRGWHSRMFRIGAILALLAAALAVWPASGSHGFTVLVLSVILLAYGFLPALAVLGISTWVRRKRPERGGAHERFNSILAAACLFVVLLAPANFAGDLISSARMERAKDRIVATVVPPLEAYRAAHGRYPESLEQARDAGIEVPKPVAPERLQYESDPEGEGYHLFYDAPEGRFLSGLWSYDSDVGRWVSAD